MAELSRGQILKDPEVIGTGSNGASIKLYDSSETYSLTVKAPDTLDANFTLTLPATDGTPDQFLQSDGNGVLTWTTIVAPAAGSQGQLQYNNLGLFAAAAGLTTDGTHLTIAAAGELRLADDVFGSYIGLKAPAFVDSNTTYTLPTTIGTVGQVLKIAVGRTDSEATLVWADDLTSEAAQFVGGAYAAVQYNNGGVFGGNAGFTYDIGDNRLSVGSIITTDNSSNSLPAIEVGGAVFNLGTNQGALSIGTLGYTATGVLANFTNNLNGRSNITISNNAVATSASSNIIVANDASTDTTYQGNFGINSSGFTGGGAFQDPNGTVLYSVSGTLTLGSSTAHDVRVVANNTTRATISSAGVITLSPTTALNINGGIPLRLQDNDSSNYVGIVAPANVTSNYTLTLPSAIGATGDCIAFTSAGVGSFVSTVRTINYVIDGGGAVISSGSKGHVVIDIDCTIIGWTILSDAVGSITVDVRKSTYIGFPTTTSIAGSELPVLSSAQKNQNIVLATWIASITAGDVLEFFVTGSPTTVTRVTVALRVLPT